MPPAQFSSLPAARFRYSDHKHTVQYCFYWGKTETYC